MHCGSCQAENPPRANFCNACGSRLGGTDVVPVTRTPRDYTPRHLAERILTSRSALEGERKTVTALFVDIIGSMAFSEQVDPEAWHAVMDRFFRILAEGVHRYEGTVNQYTGDGIMALFGAPIAHEDHAQRACHAALGLRAALSRYVEDLKRTRGFGFSVRMGLNSGDVVVGRIGDDLRMDYTAQGHSVGLAARMEQLASPNTAYMTADTARFVEGYFELRDLGAFELKGVREPVGVYELVGRGGLQTRLDRARARGLTTFVSRDREIATLSEALDRARSGQGQILCLVGEAGVGKSRLCYEFSEQCRDAGLRVLETQCVSYGRGEPLLPVARLLRSLGGVEEGDPDERVREKLAGRLMRLSPELADSLPALYEILGVPDSEPEPNASPQTRHRQAIEVIQRSLRGDQRGAPTLLVWEDLHWLDEGTEALLLELCNGLADAPALLLTNFRPEYRPAFADRPNATTLTLAPLGRSGIRRLLDHMLGRDPGLSLLRRKIEERCGGNPFFAEELVHSLHDAGGLQGLPGAYRAADAAAADSLPSSIQTLLAARIDRLSESEKEIVQTAAVIGRQFSVPLLGAILRLSAEQLSAGLERLERVNMLVPEAHSPEVQYAFRHPLTHEVAYGALLGVTRSRIHGTVARWIEAHSGERPDRHAPALAHHFERAGESLEAARWHARAAATAAQIDVARALSHYECVRALTQDLPGTREVQRLQLQACLGAVEVSGRLGLSLSQAEELFATGVELADAIADEGAQARLHAGLAARLGWSGDPVGQRHHLAQAARIAESLSDLDANLAVMQRAYVAEFHAGSLRTALDHTRRGIERAEREGALGRSAEIDQRYRTLLMSSANVLTQLGELRKAEDLLLRSARLEREAGAELHAGHTWQLVTANLSHYRGRRSECLRDAQALVALARRTGSTWADPVSQATLGRARLGNQDWQGALEAFEHALTRARELELGLESEALYVIGLAEACGGCALTGRARELAAEAIAIAQRRGTRFWEVEARVGCARLLLRTAAASETKTIEQNLERASMLIDETGGEVLRPVIVELRAELAGCLGDAAARAAGLRQARGAYQALGADGHFRRLAAE